MFPPAPARQLPPAAAKLRSMSVSTVVRPSPRRLPGTRIRLWRARASRLRRALLRADARLARRSGPAVGAAHELVWFGLKQAWACLFGGAMLALLVATWRWYPHDAPLTRYDMLTLSALTLQLALWRLRLETPREAAAIAVFHVVGTVMEVFKTAVGSWLYPESALLRIGGVPLFTGFMYASIGSYIARAWRLFEFRFERHPSRAACIALAVAIYANFFLHHWLPDIRVLLFGALLLLFGPCTVHFRVRRQWRRMPLLLGFVLVALFIWLAENTGTFVHAWQYPNQRDGWTLVPPAKLGAWLLLMVISYVLVALLQPRRAGATGPLQWPAGGEGGTLCGSRPQPPPREPCSRKIAALPATTPNSPTRSPPSASARKITSN